MNTIQKAIWWLLAITATLALLSLLPDLDRPCDREPAKCTNPNHHHQP